RFGELAHTLKDYEGGKVHPALMFVTNEKRDGKYVGALPDGEMFFHSDMCYLERPLSAAMLFAIALPPEGGNTVFAGMYAACQAGGWGIWAHSCTRGGRRGFPATHLRKRRGGAVRGDRPY